MRRLSLSLQIFLSILLVALGAVLAVGLIARNALSAAFDSYLTNLPQPAAGMPGRQHLGRMMLGGADVDAAIHRRDESLLGAAVAVVIAVVVAILLARYLSRPLRRLETGAEELAGGDLSHRVDVAGPAEVAALGDAFNRLADSLQEAEVLRKRLVADVSHELRNPIAAARAQAEGMAEGILATDAARLNSLVEDLHHLSALVDDLQELAVAEAGRLHYDMQPLDLSDLVSHEVARAAASASSEVVLTASVPDAPVFLMGDELRLSEVLRNLLTNALRHTARGSVTTTVAPLDGGEVEVCVTDTGEGIPPEDLPYVFERFYRADSARAADTGGAGLGLAITQRIVADHGGSTFARNEPTGGASVGFRLPVGDATA